MSRLERWSRIKRNVPTQEDMSPPELATREPLEKAPEEHNAAAGHQAEQSPDAALTTQEASPAQAPEPGSLDHTLPDPETLEAGSDFSAFMAPGVSGPLRRQALKRLWSTGNYNVRDGLDDYDADYKQLLKPMGPELASKLRRWTHKVEEAIDKTIEEAKSEPSHVDAVDQQADEQVETLDDAISTPSADSDDVVKDDAKDDVKGNSKGDVNNKAKNASPDDQSDNLSGTNTKT